MFRPLSDFHDFVSYAHHVIEDGGAVVAHTIWIERAAWGDSTLTCDGPLGLTGGGVDGVEGTLTGTLDGNEQSLDLRLWIDGNTTSGQATSAGHERRPRATVVNHKEQ